MEPVFARTKFSKPAYEQAARRLVDTGGGVFSHTVGMAVHDVGRYRNGPLKAGQVFSVLTLGSRRCSIGAALRGNDSSRSPALTVGS
jgi:hypothetical protein